MGFGFFWFFDFRGGKGLRPTGLEFRVCAQSVVFLGLGFGPTGWGLGLRRIGVLSVGAGVRV